MFVYRLKKLSLYLLFADLMLRVDAICLDKLLFLKIILTLKMKRNLFELIKSFVSLTVTIQAIKISFHKTILKYNIMSGTL